PNEEVTCSVTNQGIVDRSPIGVAFCFGGSVRWCRLALMIPLQADELECSLLAVAVLPAHRGHAANPMGLDSLFLGDNFDKHMLARGSLGESETGQFLLRGRCGVTPDIGAQLDHALELAVGLDEVLSEGALLREEVALLSLDFERRSF